MMGIKDFSPKQKNAILAFIASLVGLVGAFAEKYAGVATWIAELIGAMF